MICVDLYLLLPNIVRIIPIENILIEQNFIQILITQCSFFSQLVSTNNYANNYL